MGSRVDRKTADQIRDQAAEADISTRNRRSRGLQFYQLSDFGVVKKMTKLHLKN